MTGAGMAGLTYFANNEDDPYITLKDPVSNTIYIHSQKHASYNKSVDILQQTCYQQANIRMCLHGLQQLVDDKCVASCQHTCCVDCQNLLSTGFSQTCHIRCCL